MLTPICRCYLGYSKNATLPIGILLAFAAIALSACGDRGSVDYGKNGVVEGGVGKLRCEKPNKTYTSDIDAAVSAAVKTAGTVGSGDVAAKLKSEVVKLQDYSQQGLDVDLILFRVCEMSINRGFTNEQTASLIKDSINAWNAKGKTDSKIELVSYDLTYPEKEDGIGPTIDLKLRNIGDQVAFVKDISFEVLGNATYEDCRKPEYEVVESSATYDVDLLTSPRLAISHKIKPQDVDRITIKIGRSRGGPTVTVYKAILKVTYDEDDKIAASEPIYLRMVGPTVPLAMFLPGGNKKEWDACVARNKAEFGKIGYDIYAKR